METIDNRRAHRIDEDELLTRAFQLADEARAQGDHPFGALLAFEGAIVAEARNRVNTDRDVTAHAETTLVRIVERAGLLPQLASGVVYTSCEPCPMCVGALFWSGSRHVVFGLSNARLVDLCFESSGERIGFEVAAREVTSIPPIHFEGPYREDEAAAGHDGFWLPGG